MSRTTVEGLLQIVSSWVQDVTGRPTLIQNTNGPALARSYCTVWLTSFRPLRHDVKEYSCPDPNTFTETIRGLADITIDVTAWGGDDAMQIMNRLHRSTLADARAFDIYTVMGRGAVGEIRDLTAATSGAQRPRLEFRMTGQAAFEEQFNAQFFESIGIVINEQELGEVARFDIGVNNPPEHLRPTT